jgi:hypothetical protein
MDERDKPRHLGGLLLILALVIHACLVFWAIVLFDLERWLPTWAFILICTLSGGVMISIPLYIEYRYIDKPKDKQNHK